LQAVNTKIMAAIKNIFVFIIVNLLNVNS
jgi:hypothetical protein